MSIWRGLLIGSLCSMFVAACSSGENEDSEYSGGSDYNSGEGTGSRSRGNRDENYDNLPRTDIGDTLYFYDDAPSNNDSSNSLHYEPGPDNNADSAFIEGNDYANNREFPQSFDSEQNDDTDNAIDSAYNTKVDIGKQSETAKELFFQLTNTSDKKSQKKIYRDIIIKCPDTHEAQLAYFKLSNIMMFEESEPDYSGVIKLLKDFHIRYPKSSRLNSILPFLLRAYEELNRWDKLAEVYTFIIRNSPEALRKDLVKHYYKYAQSLERTRRKEEAIIWYKKTLEKDNGKDNNIFINLARTRLIELEGNKNN